MMIWSMHAICSLRGNLKMSDFAAHNFVILGAKGLIGVEMSKELILLGVPKSNMHFVHRNEPLPSVAGHDKLIVINATNANGALLKNLIDNLNQEYGRFEFWHISSQAVQNKTQYGKIKHEDEMVVNSHCKTAKIYRLGVPVIRSGTAVYGLGYWNTIRLVAKGTVNARAISLCGVKLELIETMVRSLAQDYKEPGELQTYRLQSILRKFIPFRRVNRVLSYLNFCVIG